jgi:hypothetical protein
MSVTVVEVDSSGVERFLPLIFWGCAILSIGLSLAGLIWRKPWMLVVGAVLAGPISFHLGATPRFRTWGFFLPGLQIASALLVRRSLAFATVLLVPFVALVMWLAIVVLRSMAGIS